MSRYFYFILTVIFALGSFYLMFISYEESYIQGEIERRKNYIEEKTLDLIRYYNVYESKETSSYEKKIILNIVKQHFSNFDTTFVEQVQLKKFLTLARKTGD